MSKNCEELRHDFFGQELAVGDRVAFIDTRYQELRHGEILKLNEKLATIRNLDYDGPWPKKVGHGVTMRGFGSIIKEV